MIKQYAWHEAKRLSNLEKHKLDFLDADMVLENPLRFEIDSIRHGEHRKQAFAYVFEVLTVLTVAYLPDHQVQRIISFRPANKKEVEVYYEWLDHNYDA